MNFDLKYNIEVFKNYEGFIDCVYKIYWNYILTDGKYVSVRDGVMELPRPSESASYISFDLLTHDKIKEWFESQPDFILLQESMFNEIEDLKQKPTEFKTLLVHPQ